MERDYRAGLLLFLIALAVSMPGVSAQEYQAGELVFSRNGHLVTSVSLAYPRLASMSFVLSGTGESSGLELDFDRIVVDASELYPANPVYELRPSVGGGGECVEYFEDGELRGYRCSVEDVLLRPLSERGSVFLTVWDGFSQETLELPFSFIIDSTSPSVVSMETQCDSEGNCYIGNEQSEIAIEFEDSQGTFDQWQIFYTAGNTGPFQAISCEGMTCMGVVRSNCQHGQGVAVRISSSAQGLPSRDDAGNPVEQYSRTFKCDRISPQVREFSYESSSGTGAIRQGDTATITAVVEDASGVIALANFEDLTGVDEASEEACDEQAPGLHECSISFVASEQGYKRSSVDFEFRDFAGNSVERREEFEILVREGNERGNIWNIRTARASPDSLNRKTLQYYDKTVSFMIQVTSTIPGADVVHQRLDHCRIEGSSAGLNYRMISPGKVASAQLEIPRSLWNFPDDRITVECNVTTYSRVGRAAVSQPETDALRFNLRLEEYNDVPDMIFEELNHSRESRREFRKILSAVNKFSTLASSMCRISQILSGAQSAVSSAQGAVCATGDAVPPLKVITEPVGNALRGVSEAMGVGSIAAWKGFGMFCQLMTCDFDPFGAKEAIWNSVPGKDTLESMGFEQEMLLRPENNLLTSVATACLPGISTNLKKMEAIQCEYERCLSEESLQYGIPSSSCRKAKAVNDCRFWSRQATEGVLPWTMVYESLKNYATELITNPFAAGAFVADLFICPAIPHCTSNAICVVPKAATTASQIMGVMNNIKATKDAFKTTLSDNSLFCDYADAADPDLRPTLGELSQEGESGSEWKCDEELCANEKIVYLSEGIVGLRAYDQDGVHYVKIGESFYPVSNEKLEGSAEVYRYVIDTSSPAETDIDTVVIGWHPLGDHDIITDKDGNSLEDEFLGNIEEAKQQLNAQKELAQQELTPEQKKYIEAKEKLKMLNSLDKTLDNYDGEDPGRAGTALAFWKKKHCADQQCSDSLIEKLEAAIQACNAGERCSERINSVQEEVDQEWDAAADDIPEAQWNSPARLGRALIGAYEIGGFFAEVWPSAVESEWRSKVYEWVGEHLSTGAAAEEAAEALDICTTEFDTDAVGTYGRPELGRWPAVHIEGVKKKEGDINKYAVTATVMPPQRDLISFSIVLVGNEEKVLEPLVELRPGDDPYSKTRSNFLELESSGEFGQVCIHFHELNQDYRNHLGLEAGRYCNRVIAG